MRLLLVLTLLLSTLSACKSQPEDLAAAQLAALEGLEAEIRWTSYGIPHVKAADWHGLGYGFAYATATDAVCVIARDVMMVNGELSRHLGPDGGNLESDIFHKAVLTREKLDEFVAAQSERGNQFSAGYVAGYNRYLADHKADLPASCQDQPWVQPITDDDVTRLTIGVGIRYGLGRYQKAIANAAADEQPARISRMEHELPVGIGSNAVAVGRDLSSSGRGILLGNPHYPWHGSSRFHLIHTTIPGEVDVMGTSLLTTSRIAIGFNKDVAWTHTVSSALRSTLYQLQLNPENPQQYLYEGEYRDLEGQPVEVSVKGEDDAVTTETRTIYFSHYGPIVESDELPWTGTTAYALRDAVIDNYQSADTYDELNKASSTDEIVEAISGQGTYWVNTIAADRHGNALYADISGTPNVDAELIDRCRVEVEGIPNQVIVLDGARADCEWREDDSSKVPGALPPSQMPKLTRDDYVTNSNDSYWLSNPSAPLEGFSPIIGAERTARSLRTRAGLVMMEEMIDSGEKITPDDIQYMLYNHRNYGAELLLDDVLNVCDENIEKICDALGKWDRTMTNDSRGGHTWREFWDHARKIDGNLWATPFDPENPVHTPSGLRTDDPEIAAALREALSKAEEELNGANIALDARLGDIQYAERNGQKIPIPGGEGWAGMFSMIVTNLEEDKGYSPIIHGNSFVHVTSWDEEGNLDPRAILTYSQSPEPESAHYSDQTEIYSQGGWITLPFTDEEIEADPNLRRLELKR